ncbi:hypothetical protein LEP1GSC202_3004 [Leptospira yanagawae serovar Saopaulo str. Sao Paulo = ATCC 700523]|uniref:Uncharacterized protein n=1 Tax=Leptospira yanagawae serovar Saopaulo str. Sao Paulo = ATCC 700523 TaxID=1249483 RepID=A0A5E8HA71_9LEPT|nr:hypothetical protein LEP1GSC202_3004 [Leptospira yanagawae serovar Saopaulo str. Sao Paulo = ATCC 700523]
MSPISKNSGGFPYPLTAVSLKEYDPHFSILIFICNLFNQENSSFWFLDSQKDTPILWILKGNSDLSMYYFLKMVPKNEILGLQKIYILVTKIYICKENDLLKYIKFYGN